MSIIVPNKHGVQFIIDECDADQVLRYKWARTGKDKLNLVCSALKREDRNIAFLHRFIMRPQVGEVVDHINGDKLDNRRANLRVCTLTENNRNKRVWPNKKSGYKGVFPVSYVPKKPGKSRSWQALIMANRKLHYLGCFPSEVEAACAYDAAARELHGEFASLNFPLAGEVSAFGPNSLHFGAIAHA